MVDLAVVLGDDGTGESVRDVVVDLDGVLDVTPDSSPKPKQQGKRTRARDVNVTLSVMPEVSANSESADGVSAPSSLSS